MLGMRLDRLKRGRRMFIFSFATAFCASGADAQSSTNCIAMGAGMVHCDTMSMATPQPTYDGGEALGRGIGALIARGRENAFRKKVGKMLADGNCQGATAYAYEKGRFELGSAIAHSCASSAAR